MFWILLLFCVLPVFEIYLAIALYWQVGGMPVLAAVFATGLLGAVLAWFQSDTILDSVLTVSGTRRYIRKDMLESVGAIVGCALLVTPGFVTDALGLALLVPALRLRLSRFIFFNFLGGTILGEWDEDEPGKDDPDPARPNDI